MFPIISDLPSASFILSIFGVPFNTQVAPLNALFEFQFLFKKLRVEECVGALKKFSI